MADNYLKELFIDEAKPALSRHGSGSGGGGAPVITDFSYFCCYNIRADVLSQFDTSKGEIFDSMFMGWSDYGGDEPIPTIDTSNGTDFSGMFSEGWSITVIPPINTSKGKDFKSMFRDCDQITEIPELDTSNGVYFSNMFNGCTSLVTIPKLDARSMDGYNILNMFAGCEALENLYLYNIKCPIDLTDCVSLSVDSLVHTAKELVRRDGSPKNFYIGRENEAKIANVYCKIVDFTTEKLDMVLCESTDEGAITLDNYLDLKGWRFTY